MLFQQKDKTPLFIQSAVFIALRCMTYFVLVCALFIFGTIIFKGIGNVSWKFLSEAPRTLSVDRQVTYADGTKATVTDSIVYADGGIFPAILGTVLLVMGSIAIALFLGICAAIYLSEYSHRGGKFIAGIRVAIMNLSGVPSIVFGLFGYGLFVKFMPLIQKMPSKDAFHFKLLFFPYYMNFVGWNASLISGWFTLAIMALPVIITASEEALRAVPQGFRDGSLALGASRWQTIRQNVLPYALPGILTSSILSIARVAGETAPIMFTAAIAFRSTLPSSPFDAVMALPYHLYTVALKIPQNEYTERVQYGTAFVFLAVVFLIALASFWLRARLRKRYQW